LLTYFGEEGRWALHLLENNSQVWFDQFECRLSEQIGVSELHSFVFLSLFSKWLTFCLYFEKDVIFVAIFKVINFLFLF